MSVTNKDTISAYNDGVQAYYELSPQTVSDFVKEWIDTALNGFPKNARMIEVGSGTGKDARYILSLGYNMELTDASQGFVDYLNGLGMTARTFNILEESFEGTYDLILANAVFLHFNEVELKDVFEKVINALKPRGRLAFAVKQGDGEFTEKEKLGKLRYFHLWQAEQLTKMLNGQGFNVTYTKVVGDSRGNKPSWIMMIAEKQMESR